MKRVVSLIALVLLATFALGQSTPRIQTNVFFVTPEWASMNLLQEDLRVLDVRPDKAAYDAGHLPNAVYIPDSTFRTNNGTYFEYKTPSETASLLKQIGVSNSNRVLIYSDGKDVLGATLAAYALERIGFKSIFILDGGYTAYKSIDTTDVKPHPYETGSIIPFDNAGIRVGLNEVKNLVGNKKTVFLDMRPPEFYRGEAISGTRKGHIPGAKNIPYEAFLDAKNQFKLKPLRDIALVLEDNGIKYDDDIVIYCRTGREATLGYMVLKHMLYYPNVRLYEGSWAEYSSVASLPVTTGAGN